MNKILRILTLLLLCSTTTWAITITPGPGNFPNDDNVLFNDGSLMHDGTLVQGNFNGNGNGFIVDFTSSSNDMMLHGNGGQARIEGAGTNSPFTNLSFGLEGGATFTTAILNPDVTINGMIQFTVTFIDGVGSPHIESFTVDGNGQNFFRINADGTERITQITFDLTGTQAVDAAQFRIGGFAPGGAVPEGGATVTLLAVSLIATELVRRTRAKRISVVE